MRRKLSMLLIAMSLGLSSPVAAFMFDTPAPYASEARDESIFPVGTDLPHPQFLSIGVAIVHGHVVVGVVRSPAWEATQQRNIRPYPTPPSVATKAYGQRRLPSRPEHPRLRGVEALLLRNREVPLTSEVRASQTAGSEPGLPRLRKTAKQPYKNPWPSPQRKTALARMDSETFQQYVRPSASPSAPASLDMAFRKRGG